MRGRESNADRRAYETHGVSRHPHQAARVGIEPTEAWVRATLACQQTAAHRSPGRRSCPTRTRTWDLRLNRAPLCRLSYRASCSRSGASGAARDRTSPCRASTGRAACNASAPMSTCWSAWRDSNPRSTVCKTAALPLRHRPVVDQGGFEPPTSSLSARCPHRTGLLVDRVGQAGLEPAIPCSQSRWDGRFPTTRCVPAPGLEPGRPEGHGVLSAARLPDSARRAYCISERMTGLEPAVSCMASRCASTCASSAYTGSPPRRLVERRGIEPRRACLQGKPGHLSPPLTYPPRESNPHATGAPLLEGGASAGSATRASVPPAGLEPASSRLRTGRP